MKDAMPTWPQLLLISFFGMAAVFLGFMFSRMRGSWPAATWGVLALMILAGLGFVTTVFFFYLRPQYGPKALPALAFMLLGHLMLVLALFKAGLAR